MVIVFIQSVTFIPCGMKSHLSQLCVFFFLKQFCHGSLRIHVYTTCTVHLLSWFVIYFKPSYTVVPLCAWGKTPLTDADEIITHSLACGFLRTAHHSTVQYPCTSVSRLLQDRGTTSQLFPRCLHFTERQDWLWLFTVHFERLGRCAWVTSCSNRHAVCKNMFKTAEVKRQSTFLSN